MDLHITLKHCSLPASHLFLSPLNQKFVLSNFSTFVLYVFRSLFLWNCKLICTFVYILDFTLPGESSAKGKLPFHKKHNDRRQSGIYVITPTEFTPSPPLNSFEGIYFVLLDL